MTGFAKDVATGSIYEAEKSGRVQVGDELVAVGGTVLSSDPTRIHRDTGTATRLIREHGYPVTITFQRCAKVPLAEAHEGALEDVATAGDRCAWSHLLRSAEAIRNNSTTIASEELGFAEELMQQEASRGPRTSPVAYARAREHRKRKVVASLTTTPTRVADIVPVLESLLANPAQTLDAVYLWVPMVLRRDLPARSPGQPTELSELTLTGDALEAAIPAAVLALVRAHPGRFFAKAVVDVGPATKLVPMLEHLDAAEDGDTVILVADDDFLYSPLWAGELSRHAAPGRAAAVSTFNYTTDSALDKCWRYRAVTRHREGADVAEAYLGVALRRSMFGSAFARRLREAADSDWAANGPWLLADDLVMSLYLRERGVSLVNVRTPLLERDNAGITLIDEVAAGLQDHHTTGITGRDEDECCTNRASGHDFNCDANMRRYRKYLTQIKQFTSAVAAEDGAASAAEAASGSPSVGEEL